MTAPAPRTIVIRSVAGPALVQDAGRAGWMHHGVPPGGALVPAWLHAANRQVGNAPDAAALELYGGVTIAVEGSDAWVSLGQRAVRIDAGVPFVVTSRPGARVQYLAIDGGIATPVVLGGRGALVNASLPETAGRALRRGDTLSLGPRCEPQRQGHSGVAFDPSAPIRVVLGPDIAAFDPAAFATLLESTFDIDARSDRVGTRVRGPLLGRRVVDDGASRPMARGAIQVPGDGSAIVLGPDHPTTGGYPVIAVVARIDQSALFARPVGAAVRFVAIGVDRARAAWRAESERD